MATFIKNKKFLLLFSILFILFIFFLVISTRASCEDNCADCSSSAECTGSAVNCAWDTNKDECCPTLEIDWPQSPAGTLLTGCSDVGDMIQYFYEWAITLGGLATFVSLVFAGFKYLSSMGQPEAMKEARSQITSAFAGLVLLLSAWLILNTINPELTTFRRTSFNLKHLMTDTLDIKLSELAGCDYVILYRIEDFGGGEIPIPGKAPDTKLTATDGVKEFQPSEIGSVKFFTNSSLPEFDCCDDALVCETAPPCNCERHACGCVLQIFAYDEVNNIACGDDLGDTGWDNNLRDRESKGQLISCVKLSGTTNQCRKEDPVTGERDVSPDTGWGDNLYDCGSGSEINKRCLDGKCITCGGKILPDGCGGCSVNDPNHGIVPDGSSPSTLACWYVADSGHWSYAPSCTTDCADHGGCIQTDWNDNSLCTTGKTLWGCYGCKKESLWAAPGYWGSTNQCTYRWRADVFNQNCGDKYWKLARRFCVCKE